MTKEKQVILKMDIHSAAEVRQVLFDSQKGYTYDKESIPLRISSIRSVINDLDASIGSILEV